MVIISIRIDVTVVAVVFVVLVIIVIVSVLEDNKIEFRKSGTNKEK
mgnify:CR=1 FL=1